MSKSLYKKYKNHSFLSTYFRIFNVFMLFFMMEQELGRRKPKSQMSRLNIFCLIMDPQKITIQSIKFGFYTGLSLIIFFLIMKIFGFHRNLDLHYLNMIFLFFGLMFSIRKIKLFSGELKYLEGLKIGVIVTIFSILILNFFMLFYEFLIDPSFLKLLQEKISFGYEKSNTVTSLIVFGLIFIEGLSSGFIFTYMLMQYFKNDYSKSN